MRKLESLPEYVRRILTEKGLKPKDVEVQSSKKIDAAYVFKIMNGRSKYPSVVKLQGLAEGLGVDEDELFYVARGVPLKGKRTTISDPWPSKILARAIDKIVSSPDLTKAVQLLLKVPPAKVKAFLKILEKEAE